MLAIWVSEKTLEYNLARRQFPTIAGSELQKELRAAKIVNHNLFVEQFGAYAGNPPSASENIYI